MPASCNPSGYQESQARRLTNAVSKMIDDGFDPRELRMSKDLREIELSRKYHVEMIETGCNRHGKSIYSLNDRVIEEVRESRMKQDMAQEKRSRRLKAISNLIKKKEKEMRREESRGKRSRTHTWQKVTGIGKSIGSLLNTRKRKKTKVTYKQT